MTDSPRQDAAAETSVLVLAPEGPDQVLASLLSTSQLTSTPLGPCRLTWARNVEEGLSTMCSMPFEACVVDSGLGSSSIDFLRAARRQGWRRPMVFCSRSGDHAMQAAAHAAGASDVLANVLLSPSNLGRVIQAAIQRSRFEETLRFGEEMIRILVEGTRDHAIYMLDREGRILTWSQGAERMTGYSALDVIGHHVAMLFPAAERDLLRPASILREAISHGRYEEETQRVRKDGSPYWTHTVVTPLYGEDGRLRGFSKLMRDITTQKEAETHRLRREGRFADHFRASPVPNSIHDLATGDFIDVNDAYCQLLGYSREELVHGTGTGGKTGSAAEATRLFRERLRGAKGDERTQFVIRDCHGKTHSVELSTSLVDVDGQPCVVAVTMAQAQPPPGWRRP